MTRLLLGLPLFEMASRRGAGLVLLALLSSLPVALTYSDGKQHSLHWSLPVHASVHPILDAQCLGCAPASKRGVASSLPAPPIYPDGLIILWCLLGWAHPSLPHPACAGAGTPARSPARSIPNFHSLVTHCPGVDSPLMLPYSVHSIAAVKEITAHATETVTGTMTGRSDAVSNRRMPASY